MDHRFPGAEPAAGHVPSQGKRGCWGAHVIRRELPRFAPRRCRLRAQDFARHSARRPARGAADQVRPDCQPQDSESTWAHDPGIVSSARRRGDRMKRREFMTLLGGAAAAWPLAARAQQSGAMRHIGVLMAYAESDPEAQAWVDAFGEELQKLGWAEGRNIRIDIRWATSNVKSIQRFAKELVALQPELVLSSSTPTTADLLQQTRTIPIIFAIVADPVGSGFV